MSFCTSGIFKQRLAKAYVKKPPEANDVDKPPIAEVPRIPPSHERAVET